MNSLNNKTEKSSASSYSSSACITSQCSAGNNMTPRARTSRTLWLARIWSARSEEEAWITNLKLYRVDHEFLVPHELYMLAYVILQNIGEAHLSSMLGSAWSSGGDADVEMNTGGYTHGWKCMATPHHETPHNNHSSARTGMRLFSTIEGRRTCMVDDASG
jgi:hypothetical protein